MKNAATVFKEAEIALPSRFAPLFYFGGVRSVYSFLFLFNMYICHVPSCLFSGIGVSVDFPLLSGLSAFYRFLLMTFCIVKLLPSGISS